MDNYLAYRWPGGPVPGPAGGEEPTRRKKPRVLKNILVCLLLLAIVAGLAAGGWFGAKFVLDRWLADSEPDKSWEVPTDDPDDTETALPEPPRAEVGFGVTLELDKVPAPKLSAQEIYRQVLPSVVGVAAEQADGSGYGMGSGVIMREDGYILTNYHVIKGGSVLSVMLLEDGSSYDAALVGYDEELDIAVLKIEAEGLTAARFGDSDGLSVGDLAYAIGNPMGYLYGTMTDGIISSLAREVTVDGKTMTLIQTSAALNSGNSGGALVNDKGQVVGITVAKITGETDGTIIEGLGLAIPISDVRPFINRILDTGESWRPTIGITCYAVEADGMEGILIRTVEPDTPAAEAGLSVDDIIVVAEGKTVGSVYALKRVLNEVGVGGVLHCTVLRDGEQVELAFRLIDSADLNG